VDFVMPATQARDDLRPPPDPNRASDAQRAAAPPAAEVESLIERAREMIDRARQVRRASEEHARAARPIGRRGRSLP
jgi:hypothetical protein